MPEEQVFVTYGIIVITGPIVGVIAGGNIINALGGYGETKSLYTLIVVAIFCCCVSFPIAFLDLAPLICALLWFLLFAGGFILPALTGIMLNTVEPEYRTQAAAFSNTAYNCFGMLPSPFIFGVISQNHGARKAMIQLMSMPLAALGCLLIVAPSIRSKMLEESAHSELKEIMEDGFDSDRKKSMNTE